MIPPLPAIGAATPPAAPASVAPSGGGGGFGNMLADQLGKLDTMQSQASTAAEQVATGKAGDISSVAMEVERASLALQLASQVRTKAVDVYQELFRMQV